MLGVVLYIVLNLIVGFGYMLQETPNAVVNAYVEQAEYKTAVAGLRARYPSYCNNSATDYNFSATWSYTDNRCDFDLELGDILTKGENAVFITTYFQDTPSDPAAAAAAGLSAGNFFVPGVEAIQLAFEHTVSTSWGLSTTNPALNLHALGDSRNNASFADGQSASVNIADLLGIAGANLDARNINSTGPLYRLSGTHVKIALKYSNMHTGTPLDYTVKTEGAVDFTPGVWTSVGPKMVYKADTTGRLHRFQRYHYALRVSFVTTGTIGTPDAFATLTNLAVALGMLGVAVAVVDACSEYLVSNFDDMKYDDRNDWLTLESLKAHALEEGILDRFAQENGMQLLDTDVMRAIKARMEAKKAAALEAGAARAMVGLPDDGGGTSSAYKKGPFVGTTSPAGGGADGSVAGGGGGGDGDNWEVTMARVLMSEQKEFFALRPSGMDPGKTLQPLPETPHHSLRK
jgi:hypothetical protein